MKDLEKMLKDLKGLVEKQGDKKEDVKDMYEREMNALKIEITRKHTVIEGTKNSIMTGLSVLVDHLVNDTDSHFTEEDIRMAVDIGLAGGDTKKSLDLLLNKLKEKLEDELEDEE